MSLIDELNRDTADRKAAAEADYRRLIDRADGTDRYRALLAGDDPDDLADLREVMARLGLTPADVDADAAAMVAHAMAAADVLDDDGHAAVDAGQAAAMAAVRAEARAGIVAAFDALADHAVIDATEGFYAAAMLRTPDQAGRERLAETVGRRREWQLRVGESVRAADRRRDRSAEAEAEVARLAAAHPRVLGDLIAVAAA